MGSSRSAFGLGVLAAVGLVAAASAETTTVVEYKFLGDAANGQTGEFGFTVNSDDTATQWFDPVPGNPNNRTVIRTYENVGVQSLGNGQFRFDPVDSESFEIAPGNGASNSEVRLEGDGTLFDNSLLGPGGGTIIGSVSAGFNVFAGGGNGLFTINAPAPVSFGAGVANAEGRAFGSLNLTDFDGDGDIEFNGANPLEGGTEGAFRALVNGGSKFVDIFNGATTSVGNFSDNSGAFAPIGAPLLDIDARWQFTLSTFDIAVGSGTFQVTPTPGAVALIGIGGLFASRRRR